VTRWQRYWFADGGRVAAAVLRIAIASAVLLTLARLAQPVTRGDITLYRPVGIWMLLGHVPPPAVVIEALWVIAWVATACMWLGAASRASTATSFAASVALASLSFSSSRTWSHQYNVVFLAQLAFLGARGGDVLSIDWLIRRFRGAPAVDRARAYQWSVRLVQLAVALMFAGAVFHKLLHGHMTLRWALTDNLRNQILVKYDLAGLPRTAAADWLVDDPWRYRTAALLNLIAQLSPLAACFLVRRPVWRALAGALFVIETLALGAVMDLWNPHWLPLAAVFVDWDALARRGAAPAATPEQPPARAARVFVAAFVIYDAITAFIPGLDQWLNTYPFSGFPMFATIRVRAPYDEHLPYSLPGDHFEVIADGQVWPYMQRWFDHTNRGLYSIRDPERLRVELASVVAQARRRYPDLGVHGVRLWFTIFEAPAVPARAELVPHPIAVVGEVRDDGTFRTALGRLVGDRPEPAPRDVDLAGAQLVYYRDDVPTALPVAGAIVGDPVEVVAVATDGTPWLVAAR
jgi:hypothetical protein